MNDIPDSYVVGGAIRDLLLNRTPREFDICTSLTPAEIVQTLAAKEYHCKIVGAIYPIVLATLTDKKVEIVTFRDFVPNVTTDTFKYHETNGTIIFNAIYAKHPYSDSFNRDCTINSLYYNPRSQEIFSYIKNAVDDLQLQTIRMIGDPIQRFIEDPLRMIRALELSHRIQFKLDEAIVNAIHAYKDNLKFVSAGRLFLYCQKLFYCEHASELFDSMLDLKIIDIIIPGLSSHVQDRKNLTSYYYVVNKIFNEIQIYYSLAESISYPFLFSILMWPMLANELNNGKCFDEAAKNIIDQQNTVIRMLPYMRKHIKNIWLTYLHETQLFPAAIKNNQSFKIDPQQRCLAIRFLTYVNSYTMNNIKKSANVCQSSPLVSQSVFAGSAAKKSRRPPANVDVVTPITPQLKKGRSYTDYT